VSSTTSVPTVPTSQEYRHPLRGGPENPDVAAWQSAHKLRVDIVTATDAEGHARPEGTVSVGEMLDREDVVYVVGVPESAGDENYCDAVAKGLSKVLHNARFVVVRSQVAGEVNLGQLHDRELERVVAAHPEYQLMPDDGDHPYEDGDWETDDGW